MVNGDVRVTCADVPFAAPTADEGAGGGALADVLAGQPFPGGGDLLPRGRGRAAGGWGAALADDDAVDAVAERGRHHHAAGHLLAELAGGQVDAAHVREVHLDRGVAAGELEPAGAPDQTATAVAATAVGWLVGAVVAGFVADRAGSPAADVIRHALLSGSGIAPAALIAVAAALLLYARDNDGRLPPMNDAATARAALAPYVEQTRSVVGL